MTFPLIRSISEMPATRPRPGGLLNMVSKRPQAKPHYAVEGTFGLFGRIQGAFDIGGPIGKDG